MSNKSNKHEFKAEIKQLLDILVHSLYTSREIFLRELISNASDALDKIRFETTKGTDFPEKDLPLEIKISLNEADSTLTISDTGIGMTHDEVIENIGTIAKSGSMEFIKQLKDAKQDTNSIIGKFGVGFYSVFMVAKEVEITTKSYLAGSKVIQWKSDGLGEYEIAELDEERSRGTSIKIYLKDDAKDFATKYRTESVIKKHSSFISFPIYLENEKVNTITALWREPKSSVKKEQYAEFYKFLTYDSQDPADTIHVSIDAPIQFNSLLFIPQKSFDLFGFNKDNYGLDLYVRRVLIQHKNKDLLPEYLSFVRGVVDSEDIPLNISRETLQENVVFGKIASSVTSQVLSYLIKKAKDDAASYAEFWKEHGKVFKLGYGDYINQEKFLQLLRFNSSLNEDAESLTSLEEYAEKMKENQKEIYYAFGPSRASIQADPLLEVFKKKGIPVLFLYEPVDEFVLSSVHKYKDFEFHSIDKSDLAKLDEMPDSPEHAPEVAPLAEDDEKLFPTLLVKVKEILGDKVLEVKESKRLTDSAVCLVNEDDSITSTMQKFMRLTNKDLGAQKKIFEVNKNNPLIRNLITIFRKDSNDEYLKNMVNQLFEVAQLTDGDLLDVHTLSVRLNKYFEESSKWYLK